MYCQNCGEKLKTNDKFCPSCGEKVLNEDMNPKSEVDKTADVTFVVISSTRLIIFSLLSFGFYSVYWFALNFAAIKERREARDKKTQPKLFGLFNTLTAQILFDELHLILKEGRGRGFRIHPFFYALLHFIGMVILAPITFIITALVFQAHLNEYQNVGGYNIEKIRVRLWELFIVVIGILFFILSLISGVIDGLDTTQTDIYSISEQEYGEEYRTAYIGACNESGVDLAHCNCTYQYILDRAGFDGFITLSEEYARTEIPPPVMESAIDACFYLYSDY